MTTSTEEKVYRLDALKWAIVVALVAAAVIGNSAFAAQPVLYRALVIIVMAAIALFVAINTAKGSSIADVIRGSVVELRKVVWPTRQETNQTTIIVVIAVFITSIILWCLDSLFGFVASSIIG
jgi:preprotein translocase subunit SecE